MLLCTFFFVKKIALIRSADNHNGVFQFISLSKQLSIVEFR
jgi:hypothetical protein